MCHTETKDCDRCQQHTTRYIDQCPLHGEPGHYAADEEIKVLTCDACSTTAALNERRRKVFSWLHGLRAQIEAQKAGFPPPSENPVPFREWTRAWEAVDHRTPDHRAERGDEFELLHHDIGEYQLYLYLNNFPSKYLKSFLRYVGVVLDIIVLGFYFYPFPTAEGLRGLSFWAWLRENNLAPDPVTIRQFADWKVLLERYREYLGDNDLNLSITYFDDELENHTPRWRGLIDGFRTENVVDQPQIPEDRKRAQPFNFEDFLAYTWRELGNRDLSPSELLILDVTNHRSYLRNFNQIYIREFDHLVRTNWWDEMGHWDFIVPFTGDRESFRTYWRSVNDYGLHKDFSVESPDEVTDEMYLKWMALFPQYESYLKRDVIPRLTEKTNIDCLWILDYFHDVRLELLNKQRQKLQQEKDFTRYHIPVDHMSLKPDLEDILIELNHAICKSYNPTMLDFQYETYRRLCLEIDMGIVPTNERLELLDRRIELNSLAATRALRRWRTPLSFI
jgi:hypothetical protein